jgi:hypothetical protein
LSVVNVVTFSSADGKEKKGSRSKEEATKRSLKKIDTFIATIGVLICCRVAINFLNALELKKRSGQCDSFVYYRID